MIDCSRLAAIKVEEVRSGAMNFEQKFNRRPKLAILLANDMESSRIYVGRKIKQGQRCGVDAVLFDCFGKESKTQDLIAKIHELNVDETFDGIIVQLPLYPHLDTPLIINSVSPTKDVDGFTYINQGALMSGRVDDRVMIPATAKAVEFIVGSVFDSVEGKDCLVVGTSIIVGRPVGMLMLSKRATVMLANSKTQNLKEKCLKSDIIVSATGVPGLIRGEMITSKSLVVDVGIVVGVDGDGNRKVFGDVDFAECSKITDKITPVPRGVGLLTVVFLLENVVKAAFSNTKKMFKSDLPSLA
jgi:methylenetetrahydrofolate dehydrogenase (NADP+)/methenyltetrahydrofolate cyclohydrolase